LARDFACSTAGLGIEYIEEPLADPRDLETLFAQTGVAYALDETLTETGFMPEMYPNAAALVVKPTCVGGERRIGTLAELGKPMVFSAAYESGIGIYQIARLALRFAPTTPIGLDTYRWLSADVLVCPWQFDRGDFVFSGPPVVDTSKLEEISL
jgi:O-succinylbenzoate synthase